MNPTAINNFAQSQKSEKGRSLQNRRPPATSTWAALIQQSRETTQQAQDTAAGQAAGAAAGQANDTERPNASASLGSQKAATLQIAGTRQAAVRSDTKVAATKKPAKNAAFQSSMDLRQFMHRGLHPDLKKEKADKERNMPSLRFKDPAWVPYALRSYGALWVLYMGTMGVL